MVHITVMSSHLEETVEFYTRHADLRPYQDHRDSSHPIVLLADAKHEVSLEIAGNDEKPFAGSGIALGFETHDLEAKQSELKADGYKPGPVLSPDPRISFFFVEDPNGLSVQFIHES